MTLALALDTSTRVGSVALGVVPAPGGGTPQPAGVEPLGDDTLEVSATHSETVLPAIDRLLREAGRRPSELGAVVVGAGPGSFTGVRIGAALARGICFPGRAGLFAYSSLAAIAAGVAVEGEVCALIDARRGQVYAAGYAVEGGPGDAPPEAASGGRGLIERFAPHAADLGALLADLDPAVWTFAGVLGDAQRRAIEAAGGRLLPPERGRPTGRGLLRLLRLDPEGGRVADPAHWEPEYVRASSAERRVGSP